MRIARLFVMFTALLLGIPAAGHAQDTAKAGVTVAYPGAIGVIWHVSNSIAIRPDFSFSHTSSESGGSLSEADGSTTGFDVSVLFYTKKYDTVRTYISPRFSYSHGSATNTVQALPAGAPAITLSATNDAAGGAGLFGAQYTPTRHFAVYGEFGIGFTHRDAKSSSLNT